MKKLFFFVMMALIAFAFSACEQNSPAGPSGGGDNGGGNGGGGDTTSYPYLTLSDITPLQLISLSDAETKLTQMGFVGGYVDGDYVYGKGKDTISLDVDSLQKVMIVTYRASKEVAPSNAKGWLKHIPEKVAMPEAMAQLTGHTEMPFSQAENEGVYPWLVSSYAEYTAKIDNMTSGVDMSALWHSPDANGQQPYGFVMMKYSYINSTDQVFLVIGVPHAHKADPADPIDPVVNPEHVFIKHAWGTGYAEDWSWKMMEYDVEGDYYYLYDYWGGEGAYINSGPIDEGATWIDLASIAGDSWGLTVGEYVMFKYDPKVTDYANLTVWRADSSEPVVNPEHVFIKHPWGTGYAEDWSWKMMEYDAAEDIYYLYDYWGGEGAYINSEPFDEGATWIDLASLPYSWNVYVGESVLFTYDPKVTDYAQLIVRSAE